MIESMADPAYAPRYAGFWIRVAAAIIDTALVMLVTLPILLSIYGWSYFDGSAGYGVSGFADLFFSWIAPALAVIAFWLVRQATPGKMVVGVKVVDAHTGGPLSIGQSVGRYLAYFVSIFPLCLGLLWVAFDRRKQGWHDKLAGTVVVHVERKAPGP